VRGPAVQARGPLRAAAGRPSVAARGGTRARIGELFGTGVAALQLQRREFVFRYPSAEYWLDAFRSYYGPTIKAFAVLEAAEQIAFEHDLLGLASEHNTSRTGALRIPSEYLEVVAVKLG
jgi:hypothetical protein